MQNITKKETWTKEERSERIWTCRRKSSKEVETRSSFASPGSVNSRCKSTPPPGLRTLFANRFAPTDFSIVSGRRNARLDRTPYGMLIHIVQILFLRDLNSSNEKTITRTLCRCLQSDSIDSSSPPTLSALFYAFCSLFAIVTTFFHPAFVSSSKETGVFCVWGYVLDVEDRI